MKVHELKLNHKYFDDVLNDRKKFELRFNDRNYKVGDYLILNEVADDASYTGRKVKRCITYMLEGPCYGLEKGWVILSMDK